MVPLLVILGLERTTTVALSGFVLLSTGLRPVPGGLGLIMTMMIDLDLLLGVPLGDMPVTGHRAPVTIPGTGHRAPGTRQSPIRTTGSPPNTSLTAITVVVEGWTGGNLCGRGMPMVCPPHLTGLLGLGLRDLGPP